MRRLIRLSDSTPIETLLSRKALKLHSDAKLLLKKMLESDYSSCVSPEFRQDYSRVLELFDLFAAEYVRKSGYRVSCGPRCGQCCCHWAEDVYSFEAEIIASELVKKGAPVSDINSQIKTDEIEFFRLERMLHERTDALRENGIDETDLLLSAFYQLERPCPLLDPEGSCSIYAIRPMMCRSFFNTGSVETCHPERINEDDSVTMIVELDAECEAILDTLHMKHTRFGVLSALRPLLRKCLEEPLHEPSA